MELLAIMRFVQLISKCQEDSGAWTSNSINTEEDSRLGENPRHTERATLSPRLGSPQDVQEIPAWHSSPTQPAAVASPWGTYDLAGERSHVPDRCLGGWLPED